MSKILANIWLDDQAETAAEFYSATFPNTRVAATTRYPNAGREIHGGTPGSVLTIDLDIDGFGMTLLNGGPRSRRAGRHTWNSGSTRGASATGGSPIGTACRGRFFPSPK